MAKRQKPVVIDGIFTEVPIDARLSDVVGSEVESVSTDYGEVINRNQFRNVPVPDGFERNLQRVQKG
jgi:hypothetical protein